MKIDQCGMTLLEVLLTVAVLGVAVVTLAGALPLATGYVNQSGRESTALFLAQQRLEEARAQSWSSVPSADCLGISNPAATAAPATGSWANCSGAAPAGLITFADEAYGTIAGNTGYRRIVRVLDCAAGCADVVDTNLRQITVNVFFRPVAASGSENTVGEQSVRLVSLKAKRE
ncbi:MAG: type II secretion system protein [Candidatus Rokubacteria bacterium]|nr:type II secretion system protein [Candidatus Rokubacteria bacterium]